MAIARNPWLRHIDQADDPSFSSASQPKGAEKGPLGAALALPARHGTRVDRGHAALEMLFLDIASP